VRPVVYSASSVTAYENCHLQWWFTYVLQAEGEQSEAQRVGIKIHDFAERSLKHLGTAYRSDDPEVVPLAKVWNEDILPTYRSPVLIEADFQLVVNGIPYSGIIDAVDEQDVPWGYALLLRDLKSTGKRPSPGRYRFAMTGYKLGAEDLLGRPIDGAQLDYIVRTKTPYYWPEAMEPITDVDVAIFAATLEAVANGVEREDYRPTGLGTWTCNTCPHRATCGPYQRYQEVTDGND
jgi:hypothetical protein